MITLASQFFRVSNGVIGPELMRELALSPAALGLANAGFFISVLVSQVPVGILLDRVGPRRLVSTLLGIAVLGALVHAAVTSTAMLVLARLLIGFGSAGSFMAAVVLCAQWYGGERFTTVLSRIYALSTLGYLLAATPWAAFIGLVGWRLAFVVAAVVTAAVTVAYFGLTWERPHAPSHGAAGGIGDALRGVVKVWRTPGLPAILAMHFVAIGSMLSVLSLWAAPYLHDIHGFEALSRGHVVTAMSFAHMVGILVYGPLDRRLNSRKRVVMAGAALSIAIIGTLAVVPQPPVWLAVSLLVLFCFANAFSVVIVSHGQSLFPPHLIGRGVTTVNLAQMLGSASLPMATGALIGLFPQEAGGWPEVAYRTAFGVLAGCLALGLSAYAFARDTRPRDPRATQS